MILPSLSPLQRWLPNCCLLPGRPLNGCNQLTRLQHLSCSTSELLLIAYTLIFSRPGLGFVGQTQFQTFCFFMSMKCPRNPVTLASKCHPDCLSELEVDLKKKSFLSRSALIFSSQTFCGHLDYNFYCLDMWSRVWRAQVLDQLLELNPNFTNCSGVTLRQVPLRT